MGVPDRAQVIARAAAEAGVRPGEVTSPGRRRAVTRARTLACHWLVEELGLTTTETARMMGVAQPSVSVKVAALRHAGKVPKLGE